MLQIWYCITSIFIFQKKFIFSIEIEQKKTRYVLKLAISGDPVLTRRGNAQLDENMGFVYKISEQLVFVLKRGIT